MYDFGIIAEYDTADGHNYHIKYLDHDCYLILKDGESIHGSCSAEDVIRHLSHSLQGK